MSKINSVIDGLYTCNDKCKSIVNDRDAGIIPRWVGGELENPDLMVVGYNPGKCGTIERFLYKEFAKNDPELIIRFTNHCMQDQGNQRNSFITRLTRLFNEVFGEGKFLPKVCITNLVKCEGVVNGILDPGTKEHCYKKFLQKEVELLKPKVILAFGLEVFKFLASHGVSNVLKAPHPSTANVSGAKFWEDQDSEERQQIVQEIIQKV